MRYLKTWTWAILVGVIAACGTQESLLSPDKTARPFCPRGLGTDAVAPPAVLPAADKIWVATTNYTTGSVSRLGLNPPRLAEKDFVPVHSDAILRAPLGNPFTYVVNRLGADNLQIVSRTDAKTVLQCGLVRGTNPQDVAVVGGKTAYITRMKSTDLLKLSLETGLFSTIDVKAFADDDGFPEMTWMHLVGDKLLIQMQRLDIRSPFFKPFPVAKLAIVDTRNDTVTSMDLRFPNPVSDFKRGPDGMIYIAEAGQLEVDDGGIEKINPVTMRSEGAVLLEATARGDIMDVEIITPSVGVAIVSSPKTKLIKFDPTTGVVQGDVLDPKAYTLTQLSLDRARNRLYVIDRGLAGAGVVARNGVRVFDATTLLEIGAEFFALGLPGYQMVLSH